MELLRPGLPFSHPLADVDIECTLEGDKLIVRDGEYVQIADWYCDETSQVTRKAIYQRRAGVLVAQTVADDDGKFTGMAVTVIDIDDLDDFLAGKLDAEAGFNSSGPVEDSIDMLDGTRQMLQQAEGVPPELADRLGDIISELEKLHESGVTGLGDQQSDEPEPQPA